jgi:hypothetical protein
MTADPNVDRRLGELWAISDRCIELIRDDVAQLKAKAAEWEPAPMPHGWHPSQGRTST